MRLFRTAWSVLLLLEFTGLAWGQQDHFRSPTQGESAFAYCARIGTNDDPGKVPASLIPAFVRSFHTMMSAAEIQGNSRFRCYRGKVMGCMIGANLNCWKADTGKRSQAGDEWCREHPNDQNPIPMAITGHSTIYDWHCSSRQAVPRRQFSKVNGRGFEAMNWKPLN
jgi:hypothetical protein